jgi:carboxypeptidase family protein
MPHWLLRSSRRTRALAALAGVTVVAAVAITALPAHAADGPGAVTGHFTDGGAPIAYASLTLYDLDHAYAASGNTGADGAFSLQGVPAGSYKLSFSIGGGFTQWVAQKHSFEEADVVTVAAGETTIVEEAVGAHGGLTGRVTNADGTPVAFAQVSAGGVSGGGFGWTQADSDGRYTIAYLDPGEYRVSFQRGFGSPIQYANNETSYQDATPILVGIGTPTIVDQTLLPAATLTGVVTAGGAPVAGVYVSTYGSNGTGGYGQTDGSGRYELSMWPGTYTIQFQRPDGLTEYAPQQIAFTSAGQYEVSASAVTVVDEALIATGTITGRLTGADGAPVSYVSVHAHSRFVDQFGSTDSSGQYTLTVFPGSYTVAFDTQHGTQWATGRSSGALADPIVVGAGATVVADDVLKPYGSIVVTAVDRRSGAPLMSFCAYVGFVFPATCTDTGTVTLSDLLPGRYQVSAYPPQGTPEEFLIDSVAAEVTSGAAASVRMPVTPGGSVSTVITDGATGAPVADACLELLPTERPMIGFGSGYCSDASGKVRIPLVAPGSYYAFVIVRDGVHGDQFVGPNGGVGTLKKASVIKVKIGESVSLKPVRLDPAGSISGTVTDEVTGQAVTNGWVGLTPFNAGAGPGGLDVQIDRQGRYTIGGLGPYAWSLWFSGPGVYAGEWSGDTSNRDKALGIRVRVGETTRYDTALGAGTVVTGQVFGPTGVEADSARVTLVSTTGDELAAGDMYLSVRSYTARVKGPVRVKVEYSAMVGAQEYDGWVGGTGIADASTIFIPAGGQVTYDLTATVPLP